MSGRLWPWRSGRTNSVRRRTVSNSNAQGESLSAHLLLRACSIRIPSADLSAGKSSDAVGWDRLPCARVTVRAPPVSGCAYPDCTSPHVWRRHTRSGAASGARGVIGLFAADGLMRTHAFNGKDARVHDQGVAAAELKDTTSAFWESARPNPGDGSRRSLVLSPRCGHAAGAARHGRRLLLFGPADVASPCSYRVNGAGAGPVRSSPETRSSPKARPASGMQINRFA
jgi:hypothetical protein